MGEVANPGVYYVSGIETPMELITLAGGETRDSDIDNIMLIRKNETIKLDLESFSYSGNDVTNIRLIRAIKSLYRKLGGSRLEMS